MIKSSHLLSLTLLSEPEAAAVHCAYLTDLHKLRPNQNFMICDAGKLPFSAPYDTRSY